MPEPPRALTFPDKWIDDIEDAVLHPERFVFTGFDGSDKGWATAEHRKQRTVIPAYLSEQYNIFHSRAVSHSMTKGEHEAAALLNFYVVLKYRLWRAEYNNRYEYIDDVTNQPFGIGKRSLEGYCSDIDILIGKGMTIRNIISAFGMAKGAAARLSRVPVELLPGGDLNRAAETISALSPREAHRLIDDIEQKDVIGAMGAVHDATSNRLTLDLLVTHPVPGGAKHPYRERYYITCLECNKDVAVWMCERLGIRPDKREWK